MDILQRDAVEGAVKRFCCSSGHWKCDICVFIIFPDFLVNPRFVGQCRTNEPSTVFVFRAENRNDHGTGKCLAQCPNRTWPKMTIQDGG